MRQRISSFLVVLLLMFSPAAFGQKSIGNEVSANGPGISFKPGYFKSKFSLSTITRYIDRPGPAYNVRLMNLPSASFYPASLGIICKTELKLDKITPLPFRFRLGSLEYVNWLERKPNTAGYR